MGSESHIFANVVRFLFAGSGKALKKPTVHYVLGTKPQSDTARDELGDTEEHLADKDPDISLMSW